MSREIHVRFWESPGVRSPRATRLVIMARYVDHQIVGWIEQTIETRLGLTINRKKTRVVDVNRPGKRLDFLGYSFRYDRSFLDSGVTL